MPNAYVLIITHTHFASMSLKLFFYLFKHKRRSSQANAGKINYDEHVHVRQ